MKLINRYRVWQVVVDAGLIAAAWYLAFWLRFENGIPVYYNGSSSSRSRSSSRSS